MELADDHRPRRLQNRARSRKRTNLCAFDIKLDERRRRVGKRKRVERDGWKTAATLRRPLAVGVARAENNAALVIPDRLFDDLDRQMVKLDIAPNAPRVLGRRLERIHTSTELRGAETEEAEVRTDVVDDVAGAHVLAEKLLYRSLVMTEPVRLIAREVELHARATSDAAPDAHDTRPTANEHVDDRTQRLDKRAGRCPPEERRHGYLLAASALRSS